MFMNDDQIFKIAMKTLLTQIYWKLNASLPLEVIVAGMPQYAKGQNIKE